MATDLQPLVVLFGYKTDGNSMVFLGRTGEIIIQDYTDELLQILKHCNGYRNLEEIREKAELYDDELFDALVEMCVERGIIRDSRELMYSFHEDSSNPMYFSNNISPDEIEGLVGREHSIPDGVAERNYSEVPESHVLNVLSGRRSMRALSSGMIDKKMLFGILKSMYALGEHRSTPSAGKLYPLEIYVAISGEGQSLHRGIYRYDPISMSLVTTELVVTDEKLARSLDLPEVPGGLVIFVAANISIGSAKYANRGYRYALLEAGHAAQNAYLFVAEQSGIGILEFGGYDDRVAADLLKLDYPMHSVLTVLIVGQTDSSKDTVDQTAGNKLWHLRQNLVGPGKPVEWEVHSSLGQDEYVLDKVLAVASYSPPGKKGEKSGLANQCYGLSTDSRIASIKAIAEAYERYASGLIRYDVVGAATDLDRAWLDPRVFTPFDPRQYSHLTEVDPFNPEKIYQWVEGYRYGSKTPVLVPVELAFYPVRKDEIGRVPCYIASSSGVAAHFDYDLALERALLELIERDAVSVMWYGKRVVNQLPNEVLSHSVRYRKEKWEKLGWQVSLLDITTDSVPVVLALITSDSLYPHAVSGASAASSFEVAIGRALEEAEIMLTSWRFAEKRKDISAEEVVRTLDHGLIYFQPENLRHLNWLREAPIAAPTEVQSVSVLSHFNPIIVDLARATNDNGLSVVRVMSETLLPINFGYGCEHYRHPRLKMLGLEWAREYPSFPHLFA